MQFSDHIHHKDACAIDEEPIGTPVQFTVEHKYANFSDIDVGLVFSNNVVARIDATKDRFDSKHQLLVRTVYRFYSSKTLQNLLSVNEHQLLTGANTEGMNDESLADLKLAVQKLRSMINGVTYPVYEVRVILDRYIDTRLIKEKGWLYLPQENILVCDIMAKGVMHHPFSSKAQVEQGKQAFQSENDGTGVIVSVVDNDNEIDKCFIWLGKAVIEVPVRKDAARKTGVYITRSTLCEHTKKTLLSTTLVDFETAKEQIGLHRTKDEAFTNGNPDSLHRNEEQRLKNENLRLSAEKIQAERDLEDQKRKTQTLAARIAELEHELKLQKLKAERESSEAKARASAEQAKNDSAKAAFEAESMRRKDHYEEKKSTRDDAGEERSHFRKDSSEWLKWVAGAAAAAAGIGATVYAYTAASSFIGGLFGTATTASFGWASCFETAAQTASSVFEGVKDTATGVAGAACNFVKSGLDEMASFASGIFSGFCSLF